MDANSEFQEMSNYLLQESVRIKMKLNNEYHTPQEVQKIIAELTGQEVNET